MFRDKVTGKLSRPLQKGEKVVTKTRPKQYYGFVYNKETKKKEEKLVAEGWEIVEEILVLPETAEKIRNGQVPNTQEDARVRGRDTKTPEATQKV